MPRCPKPSWPGPSRSWSSAPWRAASVKSATGHRDSGAADRTRRRPSMTYALWIVQGLLAALFLFAGGVKLVLPLDKLTGPIPLPGLFIRFIGVVELLGGI